jgi:hypothetical protein
MIKWCPPPPAAGTDRSLLEAGRAATIVGFGMVNVSTGANSDILQKAEVKVGSP